MKRQEKIARLVVVGYNARELNNMPNVNLAVVYDMARPRLERHANRVQAIHREQQRIENDRRRMIMKLEAKKEAIRQEEEYLAWQTAWMRRCVKVVPFPKIEAHYPTPKLDFGLAEFLAFVQREIKYGNQDAQVVSRVINLGWGAR